jgi:sugar lactone lactonase YvrE
MAWALVCLAAACGAQPPTMHYNPPIVTIGGGFNQPTGIAVDDAGNLYVADTGNNAVEEIPIGCVSSSCVIAMGGGFSGPKGVVVDDRGNVFAVDTGNNAVEEIPTGCTSSSCVILVGSGLNGPTGIAVDNQGYGYVTDTGNNAVKVLQTWDIVPGWSAMVGGGFIGPIGIAEDNFVLYVADTGNNAVKQMQEICASSDCVTVLGGGFNRPTAVAVDFGNNIYVADTGNNVVSEMPPGCGSSSCVTMVGGGFNAPSGIAVDFRGNVFVADSGNNAVKEILRSVQLPTRPVRTKSSVATLTFTFDTGGSIGAPAVLTMGASGLDFADAGTGSCTTNGPSHPYNPGDTCTADVTFTPSVPGLRKGAVELVDTSAAKNVLATVFVYGVGTGPEAVFSPPTQTLLASGLSNQAGGTGITQGVAVDGAGNVYLSDPYNNAVKEIPTGCASSSCAITLGGGFSSPAGLAVDGAGNVYVADAGSVTVKEMPAGCASSSCVTSLGVGFGAPSGVAVDGSGTVYVADGEKVLKMPAGCTASSCVVSIGSGFADASGIAVDGSGNVYVANIDIRFAGEPAGWYGLTEMPGGCTSMYCVYSPVSGALSTDSIRTVALDGSGNIYVQGAGDGGVEEAPAGCASSSCVIALTGIIPNSLAADDGGNLYLMDTYYEYQSSPYLPLLYQLIELNRATPPTLNFPTPTGFGITDSADGPQTATVENIGNAALAFPLPSTGANPSVSANFTWDDAGSTCTQTDAGSGAAFMLAAGASCSVAIDFAPDGVGAINGSVVLTDNSLYAQGYANQTIPLSGQGIQDTPLITWATPAAISYGTPLGATQLDATSSVAGSFAYSPVDGTALGVGSQTLKTTFSPTDSTDYTTATATTTLTVNKATPGLLLAASANSTFFSNPITLTATLSPASGAATGTALPTGTVTFFDGTTQLAAVPLSSGSAAYTTSALTAATHTITAVYSGDGNYVTLTSAALNEVVENFTVALPSGGSTSATISPGGQAVYTLVLSPPNGATFPAAINLTVTGLPAGATATFSPASIPAGAGATTVTLTVTVPATAAVQLPPNPFRSSSSRLALGLILLPIALLRRRNLRNLSRLASILLLLLGGAVLAGVSGCGGSSGPPPQTYNLTVTATSGALSNSTALTLTVE